MVTSNANGRMADNEATTLSQRRIERSARERLPKEYPYSFYFRDVSFRCVNRTLTLHGRVPSFYMKQVLQTLLQDLDGVEQIDNQVDVVSATGLSSGQRR